MIDYYLGGTNDAVYFDTPLNYRHASTKILPVRLVVICSEVTRKCLYY